MTEPTKKKLNLAQIGVGAWGKNLLRNFNALQDVKIICVCDQNPDALRAVQSSCPGLQTATDPSRIFEDENIDAIVIATDTPGHFELSRRALEAGKHVFVEKPMAQTTSEATVLRDLAGKKDLRLMVGHILLYHPAFEYVRDLISDGALGEVYYIYSVRVNLGTVRTHENAFDSLAPHDISVALDFLGDRATAVSAQGQAYLQPEIQDVVFATIYFEDGKLAHLHTSWLDPHKVRKVTVVGSRRMAVIDDVAGVEKVKLFDKGVDVSPNESQSVDYANAMTVRSGDISIPRIDMKEPLQSECEHFVRAVLQGTAPLSDGNNGLKVVQILDAARHSMKRGGEKVLLRG